MLKRVTKLTCEKIDYCINKQRNPEDRSVPYMENESEYMDFLKTEEKYNSIMLASFDEKMKVNGFLLSNPDADNQILALFGDTLEIKSQLLNCLLDIVNHEKIILYVIKTNQENISALNKLGFIKTSLEVSLKLCNGFEFEERDDISAVRLNKYNVEEYVSYMDKYFSESWWNKERLIENLESRILFGYSKSDEKIGVGHAIVYDENISEVMAVACDDLDHKLYITDHLIYHIRRQAKTVVIFVETQEEITHLIDKGFEIVFESYCMEYGNRGSCYLE